MLPKRGKETIDLLALRALLTRNKNNTIVETKVSRIDLIFVLFGAAEKKKLHGSKKVEMMKT